MGQPVTAVVVLAGAALEADADEGLLDAEATGGLGLVGGVVELGAVDVAVVGNVLVGLLDEGHGLVADAEFGAASLHASGDHAVARKGPGSTVLAFEDVDDGVAEGGHALGGGLGSRRRSSTFLDLAGFSLLGGSGDGGVSADHARGIGGIGDDERQAIEHHDDMGNAVFDRFGENVNRGAGGNGPRCGAGADGDGLVQAMAALEVHGGEPRSEGAGLDLAGLESGVDHAGRRNGSGFAGFESDGVGVADPFSGHGEGLVVIADGQAVVIEGGAGESTVVAHGEDGGFREELVLVEVVVVEGVVELCRSVAFFGLEAQEDKCHDDHAGGELHRIFPCLERGDMRLGLPHKNNISTRGEHVHYRR